MACVWVARLLGKHGFERLVAIKTILPRFAGDPVFQRMFLDEARIASRIRHPNVAQILDLGDHDGVLFLAMEWIEGDSLSKLAESVRERSEPFPLGIALRILSDVCAGLHGAHELRDTEGAPLGIVHRDVSPHNILIDERGIARIIDFGIAKARDRGSGDTESGSLRGKVKYMAPEQVFAPRMTDRRADVWAVGAVLYRLLRGKPPYHGATDYATLAELGTGRPPRPLPDHAPSAIRRIVDRALAWDMNGRYATAAELQAALDGAIVELGVAAAHADVAAFCEARLAERAAARKRAVAFAISEAGKRSRATSSGTAAGSGVTLREVSDPSSSSSLEAGTSPLGPTQGWEASLGSGNSSSMPMRQWGMPVRRHWRYLVAGASVAIVALGIGAALTSGAHGGHAIGALAPMPRSAPSEAPPRAPSGGLPGTVAPVTTTMAEPPTKATTAPPSAAGAATPSAAVSVTAPSASGPVPGPGSRTSPSGGHHLTEARSSTSKPDSADGGGKRWNDYGF